MVVNAPESPTQAEVIFVIESTSVNSAYINELKTNYIIPTLEYFHGGALEEGVGSGSVYGVVAYQAADCLPGLPVSTYGPFTSPETVVDTVDNIQFIGGHAESRACVIEALTVALSCLEELGRTDIPMHIVLLCCSPPYSAYAGGLVPPGAPSTVEQVARQIAERGVQLSIAAAKRLPAMLALYEHAGGELHTAQQRNYAKDPRHLVLLRGYSLKERPPSPAPPPVPDIQTDVYGQTRQTTAVAAPRPPGPQYRGVVGVGASPAGGAGRAWLAPPRQPYANSALLTQLAQPSYPPPPTQANIQRMQLLQPGPSAPLQRTYIWSGVLEWMEKGKTPGDQQKVTKHLPCQVSANSKDIEPELKVDTWPSKLLMQLMPKQLISNIGGQYLKDSKSVLFHLQQNEALDALTKVMVNGFAGCVHFSPMSSPPQCDIKVLILLYTSDKKAYLGFIPNNQATFVDRLRKVIQQQKMNKQLPVPVSAAAMPAATMTGGGLGAGMSSGLGLGGAGLGGSGLSASLASVNNMAPQQSQQHQQGMVMGGGMTGQVGQVSQVGQVNQVGQVGQVSQVGQVGGKGPRGVPLDGLEAARQQNLEKIQHLQQTLEAAHQQEAQFKSQMDIMTHLHAAQQQEQHYKHLEEQQRKHQLQHQLQQQLRGAQRGMRPIMPTNPGLRHLLQQQPQYRAGGGGRAPGPQQFDDVANYNDFL